MRTKCYLAVAAAIAGFGLAAPQPASAADLDRASATHHSHHTVHVDYVRGPWPGGPDPYAYSYDRRSYYPYYNSDYWVGRESMRYRTRYPHRLPEYWSSWGYPIKCKVVLKDCGGRSTHARASAKPMK